MSPIQLDAISAERLTKADSIVDIVDPTGRIIGSFVPRSDSRQWILDEPELSEEELLRCETSEPTYTTAEVLAHLEML